MSANPIFLFRSPGPNLKICQSGNNNWRLFVGDLGGDYFEDMRDAAICAAEKQTGFREWDETSFRCPAELTEWEKI